MTIANAATTSGPAVDPDPQDVYPGRSFYVPAFRITVKGQPLADAVVRDVISVSYTDSLVNIDSCDVVVNNWDPDKATKAAGAFKVSPFKYSDASTFDPWQGLELYMGYVQGGPPLTKMLTGEITTMTPNFPAGGASTLSVRALNLLHRFRTKQQTKPFIGRRDSVIAKMVVDDIVKEMHNAHSKVTLRTDPRELDRNLKAEGPLDYVVMNNQYPIQFLLQRSRDNGYELFLTEEPPATKQRVVTLHYVRPAAHDKVFYRLKWGETLIGFQPTLQTANQVSAVTVKGWDPKGKRKIEKTCERKSLKGVVQPEDLDVVEHNLSQKLEIMVDKPIQDDAEAARIAESTLLRIAQGIVEGKGKTVGLPNLRAGNKIQIEGLGRRFSGVYLVTTTTHTFGEGGYTTDFTARMEAKLASAPAAGGKR